MNVSLTPELRALVEAKLDSGLYHSASEVIREGLRLLAERDRVREMRLQELRAEIQVGLDELDRGDGIPGEEALQELRRRVQEKRPNEES